MYAMKGLISISHLVALAAEEYGAVGESMAISLSDSKVLQKCNMHCYTFLLYQVYTEVGTSRVQYTSILYSLDHHMHIAIYIEKHNMA